MSTPPDQDERTVALSLPALAEELAARPVIRPSEPAERPSPVVQGLWPALVGGVLVLGTLAGPWPLAVLVLGVQLFLALGALALLDAPASGGAFAVAALAAVAADVVVLADDGRTTGLAGVLGLTLVGSLLHQLARSGRNRVTESLADTLLVALASVSAACLLALRHADGGRDLLLVALAAAAAALLAGRLGDAVVARPVLASGSTRGWLGLLLALGAAVAAAVAVAWQLPQLTPVLDLPLRSAALVGLVVAATVATVDLLVDLSATELRRGWRDARRASALRPTALLLPYALLGPVVLLTGRLILP